MVGWRKRKTIYKVFLTIFPIKAMLLTLDKTIIITVILFMCSLNRNFALNIH